MKKLILFFLIIIPVITQAQTYKNWSDNIYQKGYWKFQKSYPLISTDTIATRAYSRSVAGTGGGGDMVYPGAGIPLSTGSAWGTSIIDNSAEWNAAYEATTDTVTLSEAVSQLEYIKLPSGTTTEINAISNPQNGWLVYNTLTGKIMYYVSGAWRNLAIEEE